MLLLAGLISAAPGLPALAGLPAAMLGQNSNSSFPDEEDEHGPAKAKSAAFAIGFSPRTHPEKQVRAASSRLSCNFQTFSGRQLLGLDREPTDHFRNGLGTPRLC